MSWAPAKLPEYHHVREDNIQRDTRNVLEHLAHLLEGLEGHHGEAYSTSTLKTLFIALENLYHPAGSTMTEFKKRARGTRTCGELAALIAEKQRELLQDLTTPQ